MNEHDLQNPVQLLGVGEPDPVWIEHADSHSPFLLTCDHGGRRIPACLNDLGLSEQDRSRHIAWDIGIEGVARELGAQLGATVIGQRYSRLVIDCNREPGAPDSIAACSDGSVIGGNRALPAQQAEARRLAIFQPYHACIQAQLDARRARRQSTALVLLHSFTPVWQAQARPWHAGVLYHRDARLALALRRELSQQNPGLLIGDNQPYSGADGSDYALNHHGERRALPYVEIEIRQDLIADATGQRQWAERLAQALAPAWTSLSSQDGAMP